MESIRSIIQFLPLLVVLSICFALVYLPIQVRRERAALKEFRKALKKKKKRQERAAQARRDEIEEATDFAHALAARGKVFAVTASDTVEGYHLKELGWLKCEARKRNKAERLLRLEAAARFREANVLAKLTDCGGKPRVWQAVACEAIPDA